MKCSTSYFYLFTIFFSWTYKIFKLTEILISYLKKIAFKPLILMAHSTGASVLKYKISWNKSVAHLVTVSFALKQGFSQLYM